MLYDYSILKLTGGLMGVEAWIWVLLMVVLLMVLFNYSIHGKKWKKYIEGGK